MSPYCSFGEIQVPGSPEILTLMLMRTPVYFFLTLKPLLESHRET